MKKLFTLCFALLAMGTALHAQEEIDDTFIFTDLDGNEVADGSVITIAGINSLGQMVVPLKVKNIYGQEAAASLHELLDNIPNGDFQSCCFGNCMTLEFIRMAGNYGPKNIIDGSFDADIETEWIPENGKYATWTATLQIHVFNIVTKTVFGQTSKQAGDEIIGYGPTVTLRFVYDEQSAGINAADTQNAPATYYTTSGLRTKEPQRGLCIVRMADGRTVKKIVK